MTLSYCKKCDFPFVCESQIYNVLSEKIVDDYSFQIPKAICCDSSRYIYEQCYLREGASADLKEKFEVVDSGVLAVCSIIREGDNPEKYKFVLDKKNEKLPKNILHLDRPIAKEARKAYGNGEKTFTCNGCNCKIESYTKYQYDPDFQPKEVLTNTFIIQQEELCNAVGVYEKEWQCDCALGDYLPLEDVIVEVKTINGNSERAIMEWCPACDKFYIAEKVLADYESRYGIFIMKRTALMTEGDANYAPDTFLSRNGYSADITSKKEDRQRVLLHILSEQKALRHRR